MGPDSRRRSDGVFKVSQAAAAIMRAPGARADHQHRLDRRAGAAAAPVRLRRRQGRRRQPHEGDGHRAGPYGILVNGIAPGSTLTDGTRQLFYGEDGKFQRFACSGCSTTSRSAGPATVEEIAVAALFLADPENSYMNGHVLTVDGGWTAGYHPGLLSGVCKTSPRTVRIGLPCECETLQPRMGATRVAQGEARSPGLGTS